MWPVAGSFSPRVLFRWAGASPTQSCRAGLCGHSLGEVGGMGRDVPSSARKPAAPVGNPGVPRRPYHLLGTSTHHSSSTTRTSTKNVFLLTRFLNVSAKGENFSYVECRLRKAILQQAGMG